MSEKITYTDVPGLDGWNDGMTQAEIRHISGDSIEAQNDVPDSRTTSFVKARVSDTFYDRCPVSPSHLLSARLLLGGYNPEAGAAVKKFEDRLQA